MTRAAALTAVSALCLLWTAGCASMKGSDTTSAAAKPSGATPEAQADAMPDPNADIASLVKNHPGNLDGEISRAKLLRAKGDYDEAARSFAQLLLVEPDDARVVGEFGKVLEQQGRSRDALPYLKRAAQLAPSDWSVQSALGVAYDQTDDHASAKAAYEHALALKPGDGSVLNNYAVSRMLAGDYAGAKRLLAQAEANGASNPKLAGNLEKLVTLAPLPAPTAVAVKPLTPAHVQAAVSPAPAKAGPALAAAPQAAHVSAAPPAKGGTATVRVAAGAPKALGGQVVMQRVPHDALAGPVHPLTSKLASNMKKQPQSSAKKPQPETPTLRTAADSN